MNNVDTHEFHLIADKFGSRQIAFKSAGDANAAKLFLCLPGLLETQANFAGLLEIAKTHDDCRWISIDYCGRGKSDRLDASMSYSMSRYLEDTEHFLNNIIFTQQDIPNRQVFIVGTSMGGILAMHLAKKMGEKISGLILNDIGLSLKWSSLINLYQEFQQVQTPCELTTALSQLDARIVKAVQSPAHFDLPYEFDLTGMNFHNLFKEFNGPVLLAHHSKSVLCPVEIAEQSQRRLKNLTVLTLEANSHPVPWTSEVSDWIANSLGLELKKSGPAIDSATDIVKKFMEESYQYFSALNERSRTLIHRMRS